MATPKDTNLSVNHTDRWYLTKDQISNSPSFKMGMPNAKETSNRQHAALLIQQMGQKLKVNQLCINTAIVYMHRFFTCHPFTLFHRNKIARACIFLSAKVEEQPRRLEHVINTAHFILCTGAQPNKPYTALDPHGEEYRKEVEDLIRNETIILQTLGFEVTVDHPHTHVVRAVQQLKVLNGPTNENGSGGGTPYLNDLARSSYFMATESLHLSTFCLQYKPNLVAAVCVHIACKWAKFEIDHPNPECEWWDLLGPGITLEFLNEMAAEFIRILEVTPTKLKHRMGRPTVGPGQPVAKRETMKRPRQDGEHSDHRGAQYHKTEAEPRSAMEKAVSDKLDILIGSSKSKPNGNVPHRHSDQQKPRPNEIKINEHHKVPHTGHKSSPSVGRPPGDPHKAHPPRPPVDHYKNDTALHKHVDDKHYRHKQTIKKARVDNNEQPPKLPSVKSEHPPKHDHKIPAPRPRDETQMKKLEQRLKSEQLELRKGGATRVELRERAVEREGEITNQ